MCGIFGYNGDKKSAAEIVFIGIKSLEYRGYDSWGIAVKEISNTLKSNHSIFIKKRVGKIGLANIDDLPPGNIAIGHTRYSTTGSSESSKNIQPFTVNYRMGNLAIAHNGNLTNAKQLREELVNDGAIFQTTSDTEIIIHLIAF